MNRLRFDIALDATQVEALAERAGRIDAALLGEAMLGAVNRVADRTYTTSRRAMIAGINLSPEYLTQRMSLRLGTDVRNPNAVITARRRHTSLATYGAKQLVQPVKHPARSKGDPSRGIPAGMKAAGVSVEVTRGQRKNLPEAFLMRRLNGNGFGVFAKTGPGRKDYRHLYGPSVYQLFKSTITRTRTDISQDLFDEAGRSIDAAMAEVL